MTKNPRPKTKMSLFLKNFSLVLAFDCIGRRRFDVCQLVNAERTSDAAVADVYRRSGQHQFADGGADL